MTLCFVPFRLLVRGGKPCLTRRPLCRDSIRPLNADVLKRFAVPASSERRVIVVPFVGHLTVRSLALVPRPQLALRIGRLGIL